MESLNKCVIGTKIFIKDKNKVWASAEIIKEEDANIVVKTEDDEIIKLKDNDEFYLRNLDIFDSSGLSAPSDLTQLTHLHEASILHSLNLRFDIDEIYTFTGPILIAVNPFKTIKNLYCDNILAKHVQPIKSKSPHIFATSNSAYLGMCNNNKSQTILISGESGAGKTESTKYVMKFLACAGSDIKKRSLIESQVLESNPLLEAFGNARTLRNDNSSRFGKYIELQFSLDNRNYIKGKLCGAKILTYLLEKVRVCDQQEGERNYHIFYQMCKAAQFAKENKEKENFYFFPSTTKFKNMNNVKPMELNLTNFKSHIHFRYLTKSSVYELNEIDELEQFESTIYAMQTIGISEEEQYQIFKVLEGILYIGNILFNNDENKEEAKILEVSDDDLKKAAFFLDVNEEKLRDSLCYKTIIANDEHYKKPINSNIANDIRDALARAIYGCLFLKVVERTNESIGFIKDINLFCGVLDIFGFESFPVNSFEQLCINYTNECLQQFFNNFIFKCEEKLYIEEGIKWNPLDFPDNKDCVDILESKPFGIFSMLDEECHIPSGKDKTFCSKITTKHTNNKRFKVVKTDSSSFIIIHFAGEVMYNSAGFLEKNKDQLSTDAQNILLQSKNHYVATLFEKYLRRNVDRRKFITVSSEFREQLNSLMKRIRETEPHFIRCIKPNSQNLPDVFDRISVNEQLKYGGVLQAIKVSRAGYPVRLSHADCVNDYKILLNKEDKKEFEKYNDKSWPQKASFVLNKLYHSQVMQEYVNNLKTLKEKKDEENSFYGKYTKKNNSKIEQTNEKNKDQISKEINHIDIDNSNIRNNDIYKKQNNETELIWSVGKNLCFFKSDAFNILSTLRSDFRCAQAIIIQKNYKCFAQKKLYNLMKVKIVILQKWFRYLLVRVRNEKMKMEKAKELICFSIYGYIVRKKYLHTRKCAVLIQSHIRRYLTLKFYKEYKENYYASKIQASWKSYKERLFYQNLKVATRKIQLKWKSALARRQLRRLKEEAKEVGSLLSKNQVLMKELKKERNDKIEIENKLLKASAKIDKLTKKIQNLEKINKSNEKIIKDLLDKISILSNKELNDSSKTVSKNEYERSKTSEKGIIAREEHYNSIETISANNSSISKEEKLKLLNKIKKLELENKEYIKQNTSLNDRYNKLLNLLSHFKDKNNTMSGRFYYNSYINKFNKTYTSLYNNTFSDSKIDNNHSENKNVYRRNDSLVDILICGPKKVGKTSLLEDLFVRLGDEINLNLLRKNKKNQSEESNSMNYNTYLINHKSIKIKIVDCGYSSNRNVEESLFNYIKNSICIIIVFDSTNKDSINPALHLLQEASLINVKKTTKLYLLENIFNEKINLNVNTNDVSYALRIAKTCNAYYVKTLDIYDIVNDYANEITLHSNYFLDNFNKEKNLKEDTYNSMNKSNSLVDDSVRLSDAFSSIDKHNDIKNKKDDLTLHKNSMYSVVNTLKAFCGIQNKKNQNVQLLRESLPLNNYVYNNKKYNTELGKGLQPVYEITLKGNVPITYLVIGQDSINKNYTLLAVGCKDGIIYIYKCFRTKLEMNNDYFYQNDDNYNFPKNDNMSDQLNNDSANDDNSLSSKLLSKLSGHKKAITCIVFSFSEDKIISSSIDRTIKIWEVSTGFLLKVFSDSSATLSVLLFPTNLDIFLCSNCTSLLRIVNLNSGQVYQKIKVESEIRALEMDDTCLNIFAGSKNGTIYVLEVIYNERVEIKFRFLFSLSPITCIKFVPRRSVKASPCIIVNSCDNHIGIIECIYGNKGILTTLSVKHRIRINHALLPIRNCYSKYGGGWLMSGSEDGNIYICSLLPQSNYKLIFLKHHKAPVMAVVVNDIDTLMISGDSKGNIVFWRRSFV
ncbi:myosin C, putative [Plasmodium relictum]|uniref:Myosin C, putative n=1 Tax=Plasmodium relictum TaxID=85471 RepID=A0A1J1HEE3_PLARL|nr:myosin C, putative [Plasmodium relictum]CRH01782.1 myosin C, putative [Plasmodium relictum]